MLHVTPVTSISTYIISCHGYVDVSMFTVWVTLYLHSLLNRPGFACLRNSLVNRRNTIIGTLITLDVVLLSITIPSKNSVILQFYCFWTSRTYYTFIVFELLELNFKLPIVAEIYWSYKVECELLKSYHRQSWAH